MNSSLHMICAAVLRNYGTPHIMLGQYYRAWGLPRVLVQQDESDKLAFLRAIRPFGLSVGLKYISEVGSVSVPSLPEIHLRVTLMMATIPLPLRPGVSVWWLPGERGEKIPEKEGEYRWKFDLTTDVDALAQAVITQHGARLVELSRK